MELMYRKETKGRTSRKQCRLHLLKFILILLQSVGSNGTFHLVHESTWLEAQERCISNGGQLASHEDISRHKDQLNKTCYIPGRIWLDNVKVVTPYLSYKGSLSKVHPENHKIENITKCFMRCHSNKGFKYSKNLCECKRQDIYNGIVEDLFNAEDKETDNTYEETIGIFMCVRAEEELDPVKTFPSSSVLRTIELQTVCRLSRDKVILLNSTHGKWMEADIACAAKGGYLPISFVKKDFQQLNTPPFKTITIWSGTRRYISEIKFKEIHSSETFNDMRNLSEYRKFVNCAHVESFDSMTDSDNCINVDTQLKYICITDNDAYGDSICSYKTSKHTQSTKNIVPVIVVMMSLVFVILCAIIPIYIMHKRLHKIQRMLGKRSHSKKGVHVSSPLRNRSAQHSTHSESMQPLCDITEIHNGADNMKLNYPNEDSSERSKHCGHKTTDNIQKTQTINPDLINRVNNAITSDKHNNTSNQEMQHSAQEDGTYSYDHLERNP